MCSLAALAAPVSPASPPVVHPPLSGDPRIDACFFHCRIAGRRGVSAAADDGQGSFVLRSEAFPGPSAMMTASARWGASCYGAFQLLGDAVSRLASWHTPHAGTQQWDRPRTGSWETGQRERLGPFRRSGHVSRHLSLAIVLYVQWKVGVQVKWRRVSLCQARVRCPPYRPCSHDIITSQARRLDCQRDPGCLVAASAWGRRPSPADGHGSSTWEHISHSLCCAVLATLAASSVLAVLVDSMCP